MCCARYWDKIPCFCDCTVRIDIEDLPNTAVDVFVKVSEDLMLQYNLDMFQHWRLYPIVVIDGFPFRDSFCVIGVASDEWMDDYFNDERFENLDSYASCMARGTFGIAERGGAKATPRVAIFTCYKKAQSTKTKKH